MLRLKSDGSKIDPNDTILLCYEQYCSKDSLHSADHRNIHINIDK